MMPALGFARSLTRRTAIRKPAPIRRNLTSSQLPRNTSHTKLKKNLSHGQLTRLGSGKNLAGLNATSTKGPPSPGLKARSKRPKSADLGGVEKDLHEQEVELARLQERKKDGPKKVGFAVGSAGDTSEGEDAPEMEGSGLQEDEWTDQSASASPYSTRQNTANNSRRASMMLDHSQDEPQDKPPIPAATSAKDFERSQNSPQTTSHHAPEADGTPAQSYESEDDEDALSPRSLPQVKSVSEPPPPEVPSQPSEIKPPMESKAPQRSPLHAAKEHPNPATRHLLSRNTHSPAPALVSSVSAVDDTRSARASPAPSIRSSRSNIGDGAADLDQDELVSRFIPTASHPSTASGANTTFNTPKTGSLHTPENDSTLAAQHREMSNASMQVHPVSPGSTISGSSGAATPAMARSRTEMRMMNEKAMADLQDAAARNPVIPPHVFDRRNESLKSYLNLAMLGGNGRGGLDAGTGLSMGPEIFQGRFKAINTELKVVQRFRDPIAESVGRLKQYRDANLAQQQRGKKAVLPPQKPAAARVPINKSAINLPKQHSKLATSMSPPRSSSPVKPAITAAKTTANMKRGDSRRGKVTFSTERPETREIERTEDEGDANAIARQMWNSVCDKS